jgi:hypothetical protein
LLVQNNREQNLALVAFSADGMFLASKKSNCAAQGKHALWSILRPLHHGDQVNDVHRRRLSQSFESSV